MRAAIFLLALASCYAPNYGNGELACGAGGTCPEGLTCNPGDQRCYAIGEAPTDAAPDAIVEDVPDVMITFPTEGSTTGAELSVMFSSTAGAGFTYECTMDQDRGPCTTGKSYTLASGTHTFSVRAVGPLGTAGQPSQVTWVVDAMAATVTIEGTPLDLAYTTSKAASFTFTANPSDFVELACKVDGGAFEPCASPRALSSLAEGPHTFTVQANRLGSTTTATRTWTVDSVTPETPTFSGTPATGALVNTTAASFSFSAMDANTITYECSRDGGPHATCTSPQLYNVTGDGAHSFTARAKDPAGNTIILGSASWTVDATPPETTLSQNIITATNQTSVRFTYASTEAGSFACSLDGAPRPCTGTSHTLAGLTAGNTYTFRIAAVDQAGNPDPTPATHEFAVTTGPVLRYAFESSAGNTGAAPGYNGTQTSVSYAGGGKFGAGITFLGSDASYVTLPTQDLTRTGPPFTVSIWWREPSVVSSADLFTFSGPNSLTSYHGVSSGSFLTNCVSSVECNSFSYTLGAWNNLIYRYAGTGSGVAVYLNGALQFTLLGVPGDLFAGFTEAVVGQGTNMSVDEIRFYDQVFSEAAQCTQVIGGTYDGTTCQLP